MGHQFFFENSDMSEKSDEKNTKFGAPYLLHSINVIWFVMALFCVPVWWYTTTVTRFDIPYDRIQNAHERSSKLKSVHKRLIKFLSEY